jgi:hypothetical protein
MRAGPLLLTTGIEEHRPLGFAGEPVYLSHRKLVAVVASRLGDSAANFFARPEVDETHHRINWHATFDGDVRRWIELSPDRQASLTPTLTGLQQRLASMVTTLEVAGDRGRAQENFGRTLRLALRSPGVECLYVVGDNPVLTLWGFEGGNHSFDTLTFDPMVPIKTTLPPSQAAVPARRPWWRWFLWLLGLLALLVLTLLLLRSCLHVPIPVVEDLTPPALSPPPQLPREQSPPPQDHPLEPPIVEPGTAVVPGGPIVEGHGVGVEPEPQGEKTSVPPAGADEQTPAPGGALSDTSTPEAKSPVGVEPGSQGGTTSVPPAGANEQPASPAGAVSEPPPPEGKAAVDEAAPKTGDEPPAPSQQETPTDQLTPPPTAQKSNQAGQPPPSPTANDSAGQMEPLTIPPQEHSGYSASLRFLEGEWRSATGLYDKSTGKPLMQFYRFDRNGQGTVVIRRADGVDCGGKAQASRTANGGLRIEEAGPIECPDGKRFAPAVTECTRAEKGQAKCQGTNRAGSSYDVQITR